MPVPDPPFVKPRIMKVLEPSAGQYEVVVKMDPTLASKYPDKPFGTAITEIGLPPKDSEKYEGYTLVAIEPADKGAKDHLWIFQKLPGPLLSGEQAYVERTTAAVTSQDVAPGTAAETGLLIVQSSVKPDGMGKSVKEVVSVTSWPEHTEVEWDKDLMGHITRTEQYVAAAAALSPATRSSYKAVNEDRSLKVTELVPTTALDNYVISYPVRVSLDLPRVLKSIAVVWNESSDEGENFNDFGNWATGDNWSLSGNNSDTDNSSAGLHPELQIEFEDYSANNLFATAYLFYLPLPVTEASITAKLLILAGSAVSRWPVFKTKSHTINTLGQSVKVRASTQASNDVTYRDGAVTKAGWQQGYGDDIGTSLQNGSSQIAPCIHGIITLTGQTSRTASVTATASSPIYSSYMQSMTPTHSRTVTATASVSPTTLAATTPSSIPTTGLYLVDAKVQPYDYGYAKVYAEVFNATSLA